MDKRALVVTNHPDSPWLQTVREALQALGELHVAPESDALARIRSGAYDLVIVDATAISGDVVALVSRIHGERPALPIVVTTTSPTWHRARQVLLAGAADYVRKTFDRDAILASYGGILGGCAARPPSERDSSRDRDGPADDPPGRQ